MNSLNLTIFYLNIIFILALFFFFFIIIILKITPQTKKEWENEKEKSEKLNIKMYENEIKMKIISSNMKYKSDKDYNREWKECLIDDGSIEMF
jgi:hypothetical protein